MTEADVEIIVQCALEKFPDQKPRIISDNGSQIIAKDCKEFVRIAGLTHIRKCPYYPKCNGKIERWQQSLKVGCLRSKTPLEADQASLQRKIKRQNQPTNSVKSINLIFFN